MTFPIPESVRELLYSRHYVPRTIELMAKPIAAVGGDQVCSRDGLLRINGTLAGKVLDTDAQGRPVPQHPVCHTLPMDEVFLATSHDDSFDSRYFGAIARRQLIGILDPAAHLLSAPATDAGYEGAAGVLEFQRVPLNLRTREPHHPSVREFSLREVGV